MPDMNARAVAERAAAWAYGQLGSRQYEGRPLRLVTDALLMAGGQRLYLGKCPREAAQLLRMSLEKGPLPPQGALVLYDQGPEGYCGLSLGRGDLAHTRPVVREDHYLVVEHLTPPQGLPFARYLGWVPLERLMHCGAERKEPCYPSRR